MKRFKLIAYYEDKDTRSRVAQSVIALGEDAQEAVEAAKSTVCPRAHDGHVMAVEVKEHEDVKAGVVFTGEPYIPLNWPLINRGREASAADPASGPAAPPREADDEKDLSLDDLLGPS